MRKLLVIVLLVILSLLCVGCTDENEVFVSQSIASVEQVEAESSERNEVDDKESVVDDEIELLMPDLTTPLPPLPEAPLVCDIPVCYIYDASDNTLLYEIVGCYWTGRNWHTEVSDNGLVELVFDEGERITWKDAEDTWHEFILNSPDYIVEKTTKKGDFSEFIPAKFIDHTKIEEIDENNNT